MADHHHIAEPDLYSFLMECDSKVGRIIGIIEIRNADVGKHPTEDMRFDGPFSVLSLYLRQEDDTRSVAVFVLCCEEVVNLNIVILRVAHADNLIQQIVVVNASQRLSVDVVFLVSSRQLIDGKGLHLCFLEVEKFVVQYRFHNALNFEFIAV